MDVCVTVIVGDFVCDCVWGEAICDGETVVAVWLLVNICDGVKDCDGELVTVWLSVNICDGVKVCDSVPDIDCEAVWAEIGSTKQNRMHEYTNAR